MGLVECCEGCLVTPGELVCHMHLQQGFVMEFLWPVLDFEIDIVDELETPLWIVQGLELDQGTLYREVVGRQDLGQGSPT